MEETNKYRPDENIKGEEMEEKKRLKIIDFNYPVPDHALTFGYTMGGTTAVGFALLVTTGTIMAFFYDPTIDGARVSILKLSSSPLGL